MRVRSIPHLLGAFHTVVLAAYPLLYVAGANAFVYPISPAVVLRALGILTAVVVLVLWVTRATGYTLPSRANVVSLFLLACSLYPTVRPALERLGGSVSPIHPVMYLLCAVTLAFAIARPWRPQHKHSRALMMVATVLLVSILRMFILNTSGPRERWRGAVEALTGEGPSTPLDAPEPERDVYYLIFDGLGRADVMRDYYGLDVGGDLASMERHGFYIPSGSRSNYAQTFLSIASVLNLSYLDGLAESMGAASGDRRPLKASIDRNALMRLARRAGYTVVGVGSDYTATERYGAAADVCLCQRAGPTELEFGAMKLTPMVDLGLDRWTAASRRRAVTDSLADIERAAALPGRKFVVAHILSPHPPFVFDAAGRPRTPPGGAPFIAGEWLPESERARPGFDDEFARGYAEQSRFILNRVERLVAQLLSGAGPRPAIVIVGDHGPGRELDLSDPHKTDMRERLGAFSAYYLPGEVRLKLYPTISLLNGARVLANQYFAADLPLVEDRSLFSTWSRPYAFVDVDTSGF